MNLDYYILINTFISVIIFTAVHVLFFRSIQHEKVIYWLPLIYLSGVFWTIITTGTMVILKTPLLQGVHPINILLAAITVIILYSFIILIYILGVFGIIVASIRIRLLTDIAKNEKNGITKESISQKYRQQIILNNRLKRLVGSNVLVYDKGFYKIKNKKSLFIIHALIVRSLRQIYTGKGGRN